VFILSNHELAVLNIPELKSILQTSPSLTSDTQCFFPQRRRYMFDTLLVLTYMTKIDCNILQL